MGDIDRLRGKWVARWRDPDGKQRWKSYDRKKDAEDFLDTIRADLVRGSYIDPRAGKITLTEYVSGESGWLAGSTSDPLTRENIERYWRVHIEPALGSLPLAAIRPSRVQQFVAALTRAGLSPGYIGNIHVALSAALRAAVRDHLIAENPCAGTKLPTVAKRNVVPWDADRVAAVRAALPGHYQTTVDAGAWLGMRQGEVFGLAAGDVDFLRRVVHVRRQVRLVSGRLTFGPPKGDKERDVPLPEQVSLSLAAHMQSHPPVPVTLPWKQPSGRAVTAELLFTTPAGDAVNRNTFNTRWREALDAAGAPRERGNGFHVLRHTFASVLLAEGVDIGALADFLGHDPVVTLRTYRHLLPAAPDRMRAAIDRAMCAQGVQTSEAAR